MVFGYFSKLMVFGFLGYFQGENLETCNKTNGFWIFFKVKTLKNIVKPMVFRYFQGDNLEKM